MIKEQKIKYFVLSVISLSLIIIYFIDRTNIKDKAIKYKSEIFSIEKQLLNSNLIMNEINDARNNYNDIIQLINSYSISGERLMNEINQIKDLANSSNISIYKLEIDPKNTFPKNISKTLKEDLLLERQMLSFNLRGGFIDIGKFLEDFEKSDSPIKIQSCSFVLDSLDPKGVIARLQFAIYTGVKS